MLLIYFTFRICLFLWCGVVRFAFCSNYKFKSVWLINTHHNFVWFRLKLYFKTLVKKYFLNLLLYVLFGSAVAVVFKSVFCSEIH
jgi:hypothetical protein